ncbi:MAG: hypothetical protein Q8P40_06330 [Nitrospirota bacterium]|nr:hypothetical protein [Nitrospirota bacterium]
MMVRKAPKKEEDVESCRHETETRKNVVPVGLVSYDTSTPKFRKYEYDPRLDPQLVWTGKTKNTSFEVLTVSLHIHERTNKVIFTKALICKSR